MMQRLAFTTLIFFLLLSCSCTRQPPPPPAYAYGENAIKIHLKADPQLNSYQETPHTLLLCVYQLGDPNAFNQLTRDREGLYKLLECGGFDNSVTNSERMIINPGQESDISLNRAEGTKYIGMVAGYYSMHHDNMVRLFKIPVETGTKGIFTRERYSRLEDISLDLLLGPQQVNKAEAVENDD